MIKKFFKWIWVSSADPEKVSLTIKSALLAFIPWIIHLITGACGIGLVCLGVTSESLEAVIKVIADIAFWTLSLVSGVGFVIGFLRKSVLTIKGENRII